MPELDSLVVVLLVAVICSGLIISLSLVALARRRSVPYLLVTLALATLLTRSLLGVLFVDGVLDHPRHHLLEHGLDVLGVVFLFGAVYAARTVERTAIADGDGRTESSGEGDDE